jgi:hypothetical protein
MRRELFLRLVDVVCSFDPWFVQEHDALGILGQSSLQKCTAALRMLAYGNVVSFKFGRIFEFWEYCHPILNFTKGMKCTYKSQCNVRRKKHNQRIIAQSMSIKVASTITIKMRQERRFNINKIECTYCII